MVLQDPSEEIVGPQRLSGFYWFFRKEDIIYEEDGTYADIKFTKGKFIPATKGDARSFFYDHPDAVGLRKLRGLQYVCQVSVKGWEQTKAYEKGELPPEDWIEIEAYGEEATEFDIDGYILSKSLRARAYINIQPNFFVSMENKQIKSIQASITSPQEVLAISDDRVLKTHDIFTETSEQTPVPNGPLDLRMGTYDKAVACYTCGLGADWDNSNLNCPGHFGRIDFGVPIPNYTFMSGNRGMTTGSPMYVTLNSTCMHCSRIRGTNETINQKLEIADKLMGELNLRNAAGYQYIRKGLNEIKGSHISKGEYNTEKSNRNYSCPHCGLMTPKINFLYGIGRRGRYFFPDSPKYTGDITYDYLFVYNWLKGITDSDARVLGFDAPNVRPEHMFWTHFPVLPNTLRPLRCLNKMN